MDREMVVIITGANSGMGLATARALAGTGATIVMACRSIAKGEEACVSVVRETGNQKVFVMQCDLGDLASVRRFSDEFHSRFEHLDALVNNAGVILLKRTITVDGLESQFAVNHLGHFLLTVLLLDLMGKIGPARIVVVASGAHKIGKIDFENLQLEKGYSIIRSYAQSKLCNVLFTYELARRLAGKNITVNCVHPGAVGTNMGVDRKTGFGRSLLRFLSLFFLSPEQGADTAVYLVLSEEVAAVTGKYFYRRKEEKSSALSYDKELAQKLWDKSMELSGMK